MRITVVVCSHNRVHFLKKLFDQILVLQNKEAYFDHFNFLVVLNACTDNSSKILEDYYNKIPIRVITEPQLGLSHARNRAVRATNSQWIVFLDDDGFPLEGFFDEVQKTINLEAFDCFGGMYYAEQEIRPPAWLPVDFGTPPLLSPTISLLEKDFVNGGIFAIKREIIEQFNYFDTNLGVKGNKRFVGEETKLQIQLRSKGYKIGFNPNWTMLHFTSKSKMTLKWNLEEKLNSYRAQMYINQKDTTLLFNYKIILRTVYFMFKRVGQLKDKKYFFQNLALDTFSYFLYLQRRRQ